MNRFLIAIALALMTSATVACAASASDDTHASVCMPDLDDVALGQEAGPPAVEMVLLVAKAQRAAELGDDQEIDAISGATPLGEPIEHVTLAHSMPAENLYDDPIPMRPEPYLAEAIDERDLFAATSIYPRFASARRPSLE